MSRPACLESAGARTRLSPRAPRSRNRRRQESAAGSTRLRSSSRCYLSFGRSDDAHAITVMEKAATAGNDGLPGRESAEDLDLIAVSPARANLHLRSE